MRRQQFPPDFFGNSKPGGPGAMRLRKQGAGTRNGSRYGDSAERDSKGSFRDSSSLGEFKRYHSNDRNERQTDMFLKIGNAITQPGNDYKLSRSSMRSNSTVTSLPSKQAPAQIYSSAFEELNRFQQNCHLLNHKY